MLLLCHTYSNPQCFAGPCTHARLGCSMDMGGNVTSGTGRRSLTRVTPLFLGQCSALTVWSTLVHPREPTVTPATTATFSGARTPGILILMCYCLPSPRSHPLLKVGALLVTSGPDTMSPSPVLSFQTPSTSWLLCESLPQAIFTLSASIPFLCSFHGSCILHSPVVAFMGKGSLCLVLGWV